MSIEVLHRPAGFGLRGAWTAGVRARLPADRREMLEQGQRLIHIPLHWIHTLPDPKEGITVLWTSGRVARAERLPLLAHCPETPDDAIDTLRDVATRGTRDEGD